MTTRRGFLGAFGALAAAVTQPTWKIFRQDTAAKYKVPDCCRPTWEMVSIENGPSGGTHQVIFGPNVSESIPWNADADQIQKAIDSLPSVGSGSVSL